MNNSIIIAIAIVAAAIILKLPFLDYAAPAGRYQIAGAANLIFRIDTGTGNTWWSFSSDGRWKPFADNGAQP